MTRAFHGAGWGWSPGPPPPESRVLEQGPPSGLGSKADLLSVVEQGSGVEGGSHVSSSSRMG